MRVGIERMEREKKFRPFKLTIEIETLEEAEDLWWRMSLDAAHVNDSGKEPHHYKPLANDKGCYAAWFILNNELRSQDWTEQEGLK